MTTLIASRGRAIMARRLVDNWPHLTPVPDQEKPPRQPVRLERTPRVQRPMLHAEASAEVHVAQRVRDS